MQARGVKVGLLPYREIIKLSDTSQSIAKP